MRRLCAPGYTFDSDARLLAMFNPRLSPDRSASPLDCVKGRLANFGSGEGSGVSGRVGLVSQAWGS